MKHKFSKYFPKGVMPGLIVPYAHKGEWAVHELLPFLFSEIGAFRLSVATFNVSEDSLRPIFFMRERGELLSVRLLFDNNINRHKTDMLCFSTSIADSVRTSHSHMKMMLCENAHTRLVVIGSANMNRNTRHEAGIIATDVKMYDFYKSYFDNVFENEAIPFVI
jgi:hypothetical protein